MDKLDNENNKLDIEKTKNANNKNSEIKIAPTKNDKKYFENNEVIKTKEGLIEYLESKEKYDEINKEHKEEKQEERIKKIKKQNRIEKMKEFNEWFICIIVAIILAFLIKFFIGTFTTVKQTSMFPTFKDGDRLWLNRITRTINSDYERGDIVTFESPKTENINVNNSHPKAIFKNIEGTEKFSYYFLEVGKISLIKRIIGLPGENVKIQNGEVYINGQKLDEPYLNNDVKTDSVNLDDFIVPEGCYFVLGDNRSASSDSRIFGCIPKEKIEGKITMYIWPLNKFGIIDKNKKASKDE